MIFRHEKECLKSLLLKQVTTSSRTQNSTVSLILSKTFGDLLHCIQRRAAIIPGLDYKKPCLFHLPLLASTRSAVMHAKPRDTWMFTGKVSLEEQRSMLYASTDRIAASPAAFSWTLTPSLQILHD
uniref:AlNc14C383G11236 protein n=1 Tax=Albugo laibachii Nc14 TaxID=890382 RepID=F0WYH5_9STRA|nr:AlNc14C383G11236 [Albugo laibachii Nc14]|eukprot:CCA26530.1 AlNc14C383G11236 [Albugo laibachii Nc14]